MLRISCICLLIFVICLAWVVHRWRLRKVATAIRVRSDEALAERTVMARELYDTMLQTVQAAKFVADDALERSNDPAHMRFAMEKLSSWLGQATREGQHALNSLSSPTEGKHHD